MSDELLLPQVPEPKAEDPEDVSWALSTAEAMWARGDHLEGVKWVRRAAEAASDAEQDERSLELAKAAADLAGLVAKRTSRASIHIDDSELSDDEPAPPPVPPRAPSAKPAPPKPTPKAPTSVTKQVATPSRPPAPLPSKTSQPPPAMNKPLGGGVPRPLGGSPKSIPPPKVGSIPPPKIETKARKSKTGLESEARAVPPAADTSRDPVGADTSETPMMRRSRPELGSNDPTFVGNVADIIRKKAESDADDKTTDEWDASPTQNLTGDELNAFPNFPPPSSHDDRKTALPDFKSTVQAFPKPGVKSVPTSPSSTAASNRGAEPHDQSIVTTQAIRVVVWRDGTGVHVAPAGTVVSAITVDAVLVALDSNADLTAWLTQKGR